jgi:hypothetical protein
MPDAPVRPILAATIAAPNARSRTEQRIKLAHVTIDVCKGGQPAARWGTADGSYDPATNQRDKEKPLMDDWGKSDKH